MGRLTATKIKALKTKEKAYTLSDGDNLQLTIKPNGSKLWEFRYYSPTTGKRRKSTLGTHPKTELATARKKALEYNQMIADGLDPIDENKKSKELLKKITEKDKNTFEKVYNQWMDKFQNEISYTYYKKTDGRFKNHILPKFGKKPLADITHDEVIATLKAIDKQGKNETAHRLHTLLGQFYRYAVTHRIIKHNIIADIERKEILSKQKPQDEKHYPTLTSEKELKSLLLAIDEYGGEYSTRMALRLLPYVFLRSANIRQLEWSEIDFDTKMLTIDKSKMKGKKTFELPLPHQAIKILKEVQEADGTGRYVFKSFKGDQPMSDNTLITAIRRMGYTKEEFVPHSFRSVFSTIANEYIGKEGGHNHINVIIERCLAHRTGGAVENAYNHAAYLNQMRELMQWWGDKLENIKGGR